MRSFDELIEFLLDEVALCGEKGESTLRSSFLGKKPLLCD